MSSDISGFEENQTFKTGILPDKAYYYITTSLDLSGLEIPQDGITLYFNYENSFDYQKTLMVIGKGYPNYYKFIKVPQKSVISEVVLYSNPTIDGATSLTYRVGGAIDTDSPVEPIDTWGGSMGNSPNAVSQTEINNGATCYFGKGSGPTLFLAVTIKPQTVFRTVAIGTVDIDDPIPYTVIYSDDGINWNPSVSGSAEIEEGQGAGWNGSQWIIGGYRRNLITGMYSSDGANYTGTSSLSNILTFSVNCATSSGSRWVAGGAGPSASITYSDDGINWTVADASAVTILELALGVASDGDLFVAVGYPSGGAGSETIMYSINNGVSWDVADSGGAILDYQTNCVAWNGSYWLAGAQVFQPASGPSALFDILVKSTDGKNWQSVNTFLGHRYDVIRSLAWNGSIWLMGCGFESGECIFYSTDGENWTNSASAQDVFWNGSVNGLAWNGSVWIAVGSGYNEDLEREVTVAYSSDGINWTESTSGSSYITSNGNGVHSALVPLFSSGVSSINLPDATSTTIAHKLKHPKSLCTHLYTEEEKIPRSFVGKLCNRLYTGSGDYCSLHTPKSVQPEMIQKKIAPKPRVITSPVKITKGTLHVAMKVLPCFTI